MTVSDLCISCYSYFIIIFITALFIDDRNHKWFHCSAKLVHTGDQRVHSIWPYVVLNFLIFFAACHGRLYFTTALFSFVTKILLLKNTWYLPIAAKSDLVIVDVWSQILDNKNGPCRKRVGPGLILHKVVYKIVMHKCKLVQWWFEDGQVGFPIVDSAPPKRDFAAQGVPCVAATSKPTNWNYIVITQQKATEWILIIYIKNKIVKQASGSAVLLFTKYELNA